MGKLLLLTDFQGGVLVFSPHVDDRDFLTGPHVADLRLLAGGGHEHRWRGLHLELMVLAVSGDGYLLAVFGNRLDLPTNLGSLVADQVGTELAAVELGEADGDLLIFLEVGLAGLLARQDDPSEGVLLGRELAGLIAVAGGQSQLVLSEALDLAADLLRGLRVLAESQGNAEEQGGYAGCESLHGVSLRVR